ncbi:hypothetical protein D0B54_08650 [Solimonas sp. K1W22B-7]|uniref:CocE/NonD family hydrolase n=1 Tax=Solimonas sp. K1W22B-7 TaxID=2303331 RepID=UPI000E32DEBF|nr:CocE/NonD family hydrolase [Solimonas sp. K1W22B-7]AXQ28748.1 hypothetical protein D0B54_08650 [Solimonas sp. K1W22B-7]
MRITLWGGLLVAGLLSACHSSSPPDGAGPVPGARCDSPLPAAVREERLSVGVPSDFDATVNPMPTTLIPIVVLMPQRCPGEALPLVLYGHGFSENYSTVNSDKLDDGNMEPLLRRGYVVIRFDQRGHGDNRPSQGGGNARLLDPNAEIQDARAILDWAYDHAAEIGVQTEPGSGIDKDLRVGTLGASYGGAFQMLLAALDRRIDVIAPDRTFHDTLYSAAPGDAVKTFARLLMLFIQLDELVPGQGVTATPALRTVANLIGPLAPTANLVRTRADLVRLGASPVAQPRPASEQEVVDLLYRNSMDYFESRQAAGQPWGFGESSARLRPVPALFTQGQRDVLFNVTEAYWNARYFAATGADVRVITHEDGHMNPLAGQARGAWACGKVDVQQALLAWLDRYLKNIDSAAFRAIPRVCISLLDSSDPELAPAGVTLPAFPVGALAGAGAVPARAARLSASVNALNAGAGVFVPVTTIAGEGRVLAGIPRLGRITVTPGAGNLQTAIAIVGVAVRRDGQLHLVNGQVTAFVEGDHDSNRGVDHPGELLLPGVGQQLQDGDEVGLVFYGQHVQFAPVLAAQNVGGLTSILPGVPALLPAPITTALNPLLGLVNLPNVYEVTLTDVGLPILLPGVYPGSRLTQ